jgi:hypothetical protein
MPERERNSNEWRATGTRSRSNAPNGRRLGTPWLMVVAGLGVACLGVWWLVGYREGQRSKRPHERAEHALTALRVDESTDPNSMEPPTEPAGGIAVRRDVDPIPSDLDRAPEDWEEPPRDVSRIAPEQAPSDAGPSREPHADERAGHEPLIGREAFIDDAPPVREAAPARPTRSRAVAFSSLEVRRQPGLCNDPGDAIEARQMLMQHFRHADWDGEPLLYIDPRLPGLAHAPLIDHLQSAERDASAALKAEVARPDVFAYFDRELLLAAACTNDDVVAYYDGALHVVFSDADVRQSVVHEYTHHVLMSRGMLGPAWAQEGIAMNVARESWWRGQWLGRVMESPFSLEAMEEGIPYKMTSEQAVLFYVQSAAMVTCAARDEPEGLAGLVRTLYGEYPGTASSYELPDPAEPSRWRACLNSLQR